MKLEQYNEIVKCIEKWEKDVGGLSRDCAKHIIAQFVNVNKNTLYSILSQQVKNKMKKNHQTTFKSGVNYYSEYLKAVKNQPPGIIVRMAKKYNTSPALLARNVLEKSLENSGKHVNEIKKDAGKMVKDTTLIQDGKLANEVFMCILYDDHYGYISSAMQESIGLEYETKLELQLKNLDIPFYNEEYLREKGYDKTPDVKLETPIAVDGKIVNWIESKAQFGSKAVHNQYMTEQYLSYWNRFGPGLVIYWFGFLDDILDESETRFIVLDCFPEEITQMDPKIVTSRYVISSVPVV